MEYVCEYRDIAVLARQGCPGYEDKPEELEDLPVDSCFSVPCQHGASCQALDLGVVCTCRPGFTERCSGLYCETEVDECSSTPCLHGGTCLDLVAGFTCNCGPGYAGLTCEYDLDECESAPCLHGATCLDREADYECICPLGFEGPRCEVETDECASSPCLNNATCRDLTADFSCQCPPGFTGKLCEQDIDDCLSEPCHNKAACRDGHNTFWYLAILRDTLLSKHIYFYPHGQNLSKLCECPAGYSGLLCEVDVDDCQPYPCLNGAVCQDQPGGFKCVCPPGFSGVLCEREIPPDFLLQFPPANRKTYGMIQDALGLEPLENISACFWMASNDTENYGTALSYATPGFDNMFTVMDYNG
ncbi:hypothetical protein LAZ67_14003470 [Cordylochernes scorpioides]|uniref:EGF-like domain-containing protein n=1 Tax=Cordylochernes scorpioides TaxID=51811 RepID=A0ABY6LA89_9ARAC|nr:hypothetical protein LAZ67_14003470 [Cordylochernes scorpioides]